MCGDTRESYVGMRARYAVKEIFLRNKHQKRELTKGWRRILLALVAKGKARMAQKLPIIVSQEDFLASLLGRELFPKTHG